MGLRSHDIHMLGTVNIYGGPERRNRLFAEPAKDTVSL